MENITRACTVYCEGPLLEAVQLSGIFNDSKTFVDMPMIYEPEETMTAFEALGITDPTSNKTILEDFLNNYFYPAGADLVQWIPTDFTDSPAILSNMSDSYIYKEWTSDLNQLWKVLGRNVTEYVLQHPERHSFLPRNHPMIVPGGRFRESYYWDSWWIIRGLLVCDMFNTSRGVIENLLDDVENFGFVPNGGRIYYLDRSQPPLLSDMVWSYYTYMSHYVSLTDNDDIGILVSETTSSTDTTETPTATVGDSQQINELLTFLNSSYYLLQREYSWWMNESNGHVILLPSKPMDTTGIQYRLNRYHSNYTTPRPESYAVDYEHSGADNPNTPIDDIYFYYRNIRAGAETGWDFSSRWLGDLTNITTIQTSEVIPIELNSILYKMEINLLKIHNILNNHNYQPIAYMNYTDAARLRYAAIQIYLWDNSSYHWRDYNITSNAWTTQSSVDLNNVAMSSAVKEGRSLEENHMYYYYGEGDDAHPIDHYDTIAYWIPLWAKIFPPPRTVDPFTLYTSGFIPWTYTPNKRIANTLVHSLMESDLLQPGGVLTSTLSTGQQWDAPNSWPPLVLFTIEGLRNLDTPLSKGIAVSSQLSLCMSVCMLLIIHLFHFL